MEPGPLRSQAAAEPPRAAAASKNSRPGAFLAGTNLPAAAGPRRSLSRPAPGALGTEPDRPSDRPHLPHPRRPRRCGAAAGSAPCGSGSAGSGVPSAAPAAAPPPADPAAAAPHATAAARTVLPLRGSGPALTPPPLRVPPAPGRARTPLRPADRPDLRTPPGPLEAPNPIPRPADPPRRCPPRARSPEAAPDPPPPPRPGRTCDGRLVQVGARRPLGPARLQKEAAQHPQRRRRPQLHGRSAPDPHRGLRAPRGTAGSAPDRDSNRRSARCRPGRGHVTPRPRRLDHAPSRISTPFCPSPHVDHAPYVTTPQV